MTTPAPPHHRLHVAAELGALRLDAHLEFAAPWTVIFGASGSGKSSLLRAMCGLLGAGRVQFSERAASTASAQDAHPEPRNEENVWALIDAENLRTPPHLRRLGYAPQTAALFPHLTVRENVAFALQSSRAEGPSRKLVEEIIRLFGLAALASRHPSDLSGGERQRVNLARAFAVPTPRLMLLDEPFSGLDRPTRDALLTRMRERLHAARIPVISVTHDIEEALLLDAEVIRLDTGRVITQGPAIDVLAKERLRMLRVLSPGPDGAHG
jgi:molybdate transport system ATP-binding protein